MPLAWQQIEHLLDSALKVDPADRTAFIQQVCNGNEELRAEVNSLLAYERRAENFLQTPAVELVAIEQTSQFTSVEATALAVGSVIPPYTVLAPIGRGGMGEVYEALDTRLQRHVAIKMVPPDRSQDAKVLERFWREATAISALNHPNICTLYDIGEHQGQPFLVMELLDGQSLKQHLAGRALPWRDVVGLALQICNGLREAHAKGIVHRDLKPANVFVTSGGHVKILDFGVAKLLSEARAKSAPIRGDAMNHETITVAGDAVGTLAYMSPEQVEDGNADARSDVFSLGVIMYEILTGVRPFDADSPWLTMRAIRVDEPPLLRERNPKIPVALERIVTKALHKNPEMRYQSVAELHADLASFEHRSAYGLRTILGNPRFAIPALLVLVAVLAIVTWFVVRGRHAAWARNVALPEITRLVAIEDFDAAFRLGSEAERYLRNDPELLRLQYHYQVRQSVRTDPPGADVYTKGYLNVDRSWIYLGKSPIENARFPNRHNRWKFVKEGFEPAEIAFVSYAGSIQPIFRLQPSGVVPPGMIRVPGREVYVRGLPRVRLDDYWLDKYEVSNRQFKEFVNSGGYRKREFWKHTFHRDGNVMTREQAMAQFRDATGQPGPATWKFGSYPEKGDDFPVSGVSWYEAAAYAEFAGKSLPTLYHWYAASREGLYSDILALSNFNGKGPSPAGQSQGLSPYGNYDMAGNMREWVWNRARNRPQAHRYILGGSWTEPPYVFTHHNDAASPFDRSEMNGFRCARYAAPVPDLLLAPLERISRDYSKEKPVNDEIFRIYRSFYTYDRTDLNAVVESVDDTAPQWRHETVTFDAAYGGERVSAHLFLPRNVLQPYQIVIYCPSAYALSAHSSKDMEMAVSEFLLRSGRAVFFPVYKGTYERRMPPSPDGPASQRDLVIYWSKDFSRSIDYLQTRPDIDSQKLAFYGLSLGGIYGPVLTAIDGRLKASVVHAGGFREETLPPEIDPVHFAPRAKVPTLVIAGRHDFLRPLECCQIPMFRLLGAPAQEKRMAIFDRGHVVYPTPPVIKEVIDWLDRYLAPVRSR